MIPNARSPQSGAWRACPESWVCFRLLGPGSLALSSSSSSSLLELQGPDVLRPARPAFGFLVVAAHCAFQDFILGGGEAKGRKVQREIQKGDLVPPHPRTLPARKGDSERRRARDWGGTFSSPSFCRKAMKMCAVLAALATARPPCACNAQLPDRQAYKQPAISKSFMEELGAFFSLTPDVGARVGVGAKSGLPVFNGSPWFALWGKWA